MTFLRNFRGCLYIHGYFFLNHASTIPAWLPQQSSFSILQEMEQMGTDELIAWLVKSLGLGSPCRRLELFGRCGKHVKQCSCLPTFACDRR